MAAEATQGQAVPPVNRARAASADAAFRIPHSAFRIPHSAFRIPHSAFRSCSLEFPGDGQPTRESQ
jgi:hypothetical protein